jgi:hypothetical protein
MAEMTRPGSLAKVPPVDSASVLTTRMAHRSPVIWAGNSATGTSLC